MQSSSALEAQGGVVDDGDEAGGTGGSSAAISPVVRRLTSARFTNLNRSREVERAITSALMTYASAPTTIPTTSKIAG